MATCVCPFPRTMCPDCRWICEACVAVGRKWARADIVPATAPAPEVATLTCAKYGLSTACFGEVRERDSDALFSQRAAGAATASGKVTMCDGCWAVRAAYDTLRNDLIKSIAPPDDIRTERDQARSDLATERARSAGLTRALEVARGALENIEKRGDGGSARHPWCKFCGYNARKTGDHAESCPLGIAITALAVLRGQFMPPALTAIDAVTGGAAGDDANRRLAAFDRILAARERWGVMAALDASFAMEVGVITDPWKNAPAATRGTPGAGEAPGPYAQMMAKAKELWRRSRRSMKDGEEEDAEQWEACAMVAEECAAMVAPATPVAQQRPARDPIAVARDFVFPRFATVMSHDGLEAVSAELAKLIDAERGEP